MPPVEMFVTHVTRVADRHIGRSQLIAMKDLWNPDSSQFSVCSLAL